MTRLRKGLLKTLLSRSSAHVPVWSALGAACTSKRHGREFVLRFGADVVAASIWPLLVDGLLTIAMVDCSKLIVSAIGRVGEWRGQRLCSGAACRWWRTPTRRRH